MIVGIDLGTTYSAIACMNKDGKPNIIINSEGRRTTPSAVMFEAGGNVIVGEIAKQSAIMEDSNVVEYIKNEMGNPTYRYCTNTGKVYTPEEISSFILKKLKMDAEKYLGNKITEAVITVPAYFSDAQRKATRDAGEIAGLEVKKIINEPTAALMAYVTEKEIKESNILVYDLGGGTFDATVVHYRENEIIVKATDGLRRLGGHIFDIEIVNFVAKLFQEKHGVDLYDDNHIEALQELNKRAEECKIHLSMRMETYITMNCDGIKERIKITRDQFNGMIRRLYERTERVVLSALQKANMTFEDIDEVLMIGGSSRIPYIQHRMECISGKKLSFEINPDEVVALGAAIQSSIINKEEGNQQIRVQDVCSHGIGIVTMEGRTLRQVNSVIIDSNSQIPAKKSRRFFTSEDDQEVVLLQITEGEGEDLEYITKIGSFEINIPRGLKKGTEVDVEIIIDENQLVHVCTKINKAGSFFKEIHLSRNLNLSKEQVVKKRDLISKIVVA